MDWERSWPLGHWGSRSVGHLLAFCMHHFSCFAALAASVPLCFLWSSCLYFLHDSVCSLLSWASSCCVLILSVIAACLWWSWPHYMLSTIMISPASSTQLQVHFNCFAPSHAVCSFVWSLLPQWFVTNLATLYVVNHLAILHDVFTPGPALPFYIVHLFTCLCHYQVALTCSRGSDNPADY